MSSSSSGGALRGLRVVDLAGDGGDAGRFAAKLLAEAGADVVRAGVSASGPAMLAAEGGLLDWWYDAGKERAAIDLDDEAGRHALLDLAGEADVLIETEPPGRLAALGIDHADLSRRNPRLVHVSVTPFGRTGPRASWKSSDLVANALGGLLSVNGTPAEPINGYGRQAFNTAGFFAAISALAALSAARRTGRGQHVDVSIHQCVIACTEQIPMYWFFRSFFAAMGRPAIAARQGAVHWSGLYDVAACRDGHCMVSPTPLGALPALVEWIARETGAPPPAIDISNPVAFLASLGGLMDPLRALARVKSAAEVFQVGQEMRFAFGQVMSTREAAASPQLRARGFFRPVPETGGAVALPGPLFQMSATPAPAPRPPGRVDTAEVASRWRSEPREVDAEKAGDAKRPLDGVRILDLTWVLAGPYATRILGDLGADVVKLQTEERSQGIGANAFPYFVLWNRNKRSATLNLKHPKARDTFLRLVEKADVVIDNFSAGVLDRLGMGHEQASSRNPRIIYLSMTGCGADGPWKNYVTFAPTVQALSGITHLTGPPGRHDVGYGVALADHVSGLAGALAIVEALAAREQTGRGQAIDLAQLEVCAYLLGPAYVDLLANGREHQPAGNRDPFEDLVPNEVYRCRGDEWLAITVRTDAEWTALANAIGLPEDASLATASGRRASRSTIDERLAAWAADQDAFAAMERLQAAGVAAGAVATARDWIERDPQLASRRAFVEVDHAVHGKLPIDVYPAVFGATPARDYRPAPLLGEHNFEVYGELLGMSEAEIAEAIADGLFS